MLNENDDKYISDENVRLVPYEDIDGIVWQEALTKFIPPAWSEVFLDMYDELKDAGKTIQADLDKSGIRIVPRKCDIYSAFISTPPDNVKVVILGMDPYLQVYNGIPTATGRSFECRAGNTIEKSLQNIFLVCGKTIKNFGSPRSGDLTKWAEQGVLLLNTALTTRQSKSGMHIGIWGFFPEKIIKYLGEKKQNIVYMLWGKNAMEYSEYIPKHKNLLLTTSHPVARGHANTFFDCNHFNQANEYLIANNREPIDWRLN